jgi:hypothetical protein
MAAEHKSNPASDRSVMAASQNLAVKKNKQQGKKKVYEH